MCHLTRSVEPEVTWGDKGREDGKKLEIWGDVIYGWSLRPIIDLNKTLY